MSDQIKVTLPIASNPLDICQNCKKNIGTPCAVLEYCANARGMTLDRVMVGIAEQSVPPRGHNADYCCGWQTKDVMDQNVCCNMLAGQPKGTLGRLLQALDEVRGGNDDVAV